MRPAPPAAGEDATRDGFLDGRVTLVQPRGGHRAGLDAALLQALVPGDATGHAVDLGCGAGTIGFCVAARAAGILVTGVEREAELAGCARAALELAENSHFAQRVSIVEGDAAAAWEPGLKLASGLAERSVDWVLTNPPWDARDRVRPSPDERKARAHVIDDAGISAWLDSAARLLKPGGRLGIIQRAAALGDILAALSGRFGDVAVLPIHPHAGEPASRIVVRARLAHRGPLRVAHGLALHAPGGAWTHEADAILRGRATLPI